MKAVYRTAVLLTALLLIPVFAIRAEESPAFTIDQRKVLQGMNRSWLQGYAPTISSNVLNLVIPILSDQADGQIQTELIFLDEAIAPFKPQPMSVKTQRAESGMYPVRLSLNLYPDRRNGDYACIIRVTGKTKKGAALQTDFPYTLRIRDGLPSTEITRIEITDVQSDFTVGADGVVSAILRNPTKTVPFEQIALRLSDAGREIIPQNADVLYLPDLKPGKSMAVSFPMTVTGKATVSPHSLKFDLSFQALGQAVTQAESFTRPVTQKVCLEPGALQSESIMTAGEKWTAVLPLMNPGSADVKNVMATLSVPGLVEKQSVLAGTIAPGETKDAQFSLSIGKTVIGDFSGTIAVSGTDGNGSETAFTVPVSLTVESKTEDIAFYRLEVSQVQGDLKVGEDGMLTAMLKNPDERVTFEQMTLRISDGGNEIMPREADTVYLPALGPGEEYHLAFPVSVLPKASVAPHMMRFDFAWTANGKTVTQTASYNVPVRQEIRLEQGGLKMPSSVVAGDSVTLSLPLMNMGRADVVNVLATLSLPGITDRQSVLVGTIAPGETRQAQITLTPGKDLSGDYEGTLTVEGTDNDGNPTSFSLPISLTVEKPIKTTAIDIPNQEAVKPPILTYALGGGCGVLFLILIAQGILLRKKIHRLEEDKL